MLASCLYMRHSICVMSRRAGYLLGVAADGLRLFPLMEPFSAALSQVLDKRLHGSKLCTINFPLPQSGRLLGKGEGGASAVPADGAHAQLRFL